MDTTLKIEEGWITFDAPFRLSPNKRNMQSVRTLFAVSTDRRLITIESRSNLMARPQPNQAIQSRKAVEVDHVLEGRTSVQYQTRAQRTGGKQSFAQEISDIA
jgi:hypothetical protein